MNVAVQKHIPIGIGICISIDDIESLEKLFNNISKSFMNEVCFFVKLHPRVKAHQIPLHKISNYTICHLHNTSPYTKLVTATIYICDADTKFEIKNGEIRTFKSQQKITSTQIAENLFKSISSEFKEKSIVINLIKNKNVDLTRIPLMVGKTSHLNSTFMDSEVKYCEVESIGDFIKNRLNTTNTLFKQVYSKQTKIENEIIYILIDFNYEILESLGLVSKILEFEHAQNNLNLLVSIKNSLLIETKNIVQLTKVSGLKQNLIVEDITDHKGKTSYKISCEIFKDEETEPLQKLILLKFERVLEEGKIENRLIKNEVQNLKAEPQQFELNKVIEELKNSNNELIEERNQLEMLINGSRLGTWDWNLLKDEITLNERWFEILGIIQKQLTFSYKEWKQFLNDFITEMNTQELA